MIRLSALTVFLTFFVFLLLQVPIVLAAGDFKRNIVYLGYTIPYERLETASFLEVMEEIHSNPMLKDGPIIVISNLGQDADIVRGKALGAVEYLIKAQISIDDLIEKIKGFLAR